MKKAHKIYQQELVTLSYSLSGKMKNVLALSTDCVSCSRCLHRYNTSGNGLKLKQIIEKVKHGAIIAICVICYAMKYLKVRPNVRKAYTRNGETLKTRLSWFELSAIAYEIVDALKKNQTHKFRLEAFGDLTSIEQTLNYLRLSYLIYCLSDNYKIEVALYTKNYDMLINAWRLLNSKEKHHIRKVLSVVLSSVFIGIPLSEKIRKKVENILEMPVKVFTVEVEQTAKTNCGARCCDTCGICYNAYNGIRNIFEIIK